MRTAGVDITYQGVNITKDISSDVLSFSYTDNAEGAADDISLSIINTSKKWMGEWLPTKTDIIKAQIITTDMGGGLDCGLFIVDSFGSSGRPLVVTLKGISMPVDTDFSEVKKNKTWQRITLKDIATTMAENSSVPLEYEAGLNPDFNFISQINVTDKHFLYELCVKYGLNMKLFNDRIVIYNPEDFEKNGVVKTFIETDMLSWSFETTLTEAAYSGCSVQYTDPATTKRIEYCYRVTNASSAKVFQLNEQVDSLSHAEQVCRAKLRRLNMGETKISFSIMGNALLLAAVNIGISGFGAFDGKYFIDKVTHKVGSGYVASIEAHLVT